MSCHIWLVRHGETDWNLEGRIQGHTDTDLNENGRLQADRLATRLRGQRFDAVYSSDLKRARDTATPAARALNLKVVLEKRLRELNFGAYEGLKSADVRAKHPDWFKRFISTKPDFEIPDGESYRQFFDRVVGALEKLAERHPNQRLLVVTHGGCVSCALRRALPPSEKSRPLAIGNTSVTRIEIEVGEACVWRLLESEALNGALRP